MKYWQGAFDSISLNELIDYNARMTALIAETAKVCDVIFAEHEKKVDAEILRAMGIEP